MISLLEPVLELAIEPLVLTLTIVAISTLLLIAKQRIQGQQDQNNPEQEVINAVNNCLPQTQCAQCGHPGCLPYAEAIVAGEAINRCPPGGSQTIETLANLLGRQATPLDPKFGEHEQKRIAVIREAECIGCTLCIQACPVDAIIGAQQLMHSVINDACTGCDLCLPPCPVDCIDMVPIKVELKTTKPLAPLILQEPSACIRCGDCETACPKDLSPQNLHWHRTSAETLKALRLDDCIECRLCDRVCPSAIPLTEQFVEAKSHLAQLAIDKTEADAAEQRYEKRKIRLVEVDQTVKTKSSSDDRKALLARLKKVKI